MRSTVSMQPGPPRRAQRGHCFYERASLLWLIAPLHHSGCQSAVAAVCCSVGHLLQVAFQRRCLQRMRAERLQLERLDTILLVATPTALTAAASCSAQGGQGPGPTLGRYSAASYAPASRKRCRSWIRATLVETLLEI